MDKFFKIYTTFPILRQRPVPDRVPSLQETVGLLESFTSYPGLTAQHLKTCASLILTTRSSILKSNSLGEQDKKVLLLRLRTVQDQLVLQTLITEQSALIPSPEASCPERKILSNGGKGLNERCKAGTPAKSSYTTLKEIFIQSNDYETCVEALRRVRTPVISEMNHYLLGEREKGAFTAWITVLKERGKIKSVPCSILARLLNQTFQGLDLGSDGSTLSRIRTSSYKQYYPHFLQLIQ